MKNRTCLAAAAAMLLAGATAASAATGAMSHSNTMSNSNTTTNSMAKPASDSLSLTTTQQKTAWRDLSTPRLNQKTPSGFSATVGAVVPSGVTTAPVPQKAASDVPALKPYRFAMLQKKIVIVNPSDHKIADVITR